MADSVRGVHALQQELAKAKESLKDVDENIKKLTGRDPGDNRSPAQRRVVIGGGATGTPPGSDFRGRERNFTITRRGPGAEDSGGPPAKRRALGGAFSRLGPRVGSGRLPAGQGNDSGEEEELSNKPTVQSSVVQAPKDTRTRQDMIREQEKDSEGKARNRRMFGLLLGTLQRFQRDAKDKVDKEKQRQVIERKLEERAQQERDDIRKQRQTLFNERKNQQEKLKKLEQKMELVQIHEEWEAQTKRLMKFIRTKAKPPVFYLPKSHNSTTEKKLKETGKVLEDIITKRRRQLEEEINELTRCEEEVDTEHHESMEMEDFLEGNNNGDHTSEEHLQDTREVEMKDQKAADKENRHADSRRRPESGRKESGQRRRESQDRSHEREKSREEPSEKERSRSDRHGESNRDSKDSGKRGSRDKDHREHSRRGSRTERSDKAERDKKEERRDKREERRDKKEEQKDKKDERKVKEDLKDKEKDEKDKEEGDTAEKPLKSEIKEDVKIGEMPEVEETMQTALAEIPQPEKDVTDEPHDVEEEITLDSKDIPLPSQDYPDEINGKSASSNTEKTKSKKTKADVSDEDEDESDSDSSSSSSSSGSSSSSSSSSDSEDDDEDDHKKAKSSRANRDKRKAAPDKPAIEDDRSSAAGGSTKGKEALVD